MLARVRTQLTEQQVELIVPDDTKDFLVTKGFDPQFGARPLRRTIQNMVEDPLAEGLLQGKFKPGDVVEALVIDGVLVLEPRRQLEALPPPPPKAALSAGESQDLGVDEREQVFPATTPGPALLAGQSDDLGVDASEGHQHL